MAVFACPPRRRVVPPRAPPRCPELRGDRPGSPSLTSCASNGKLTAGAHPCRLRAGDGRSPSLRRDEKWYRVLCVDQSAATTRTRAMVDNPGDDPISARFRPRLLGRCGLRIAEVRHRHLVNSPAAGRRGRRACGGLSVASPSGRPESRLGPLASRYVVSRLVRVRRHAREHQTARASSTLRGPAPGEHRTAPALLADRSDDHRATEDSSLG